MLIVNVVAMRSRDVGDYVYRVSQPSAAMGRMPGVEVVTVGMLSPWVGRLVRDADVAILHMLTEEDLFPLVEERRRAGRATVYEISDNFVDAHPGVGIRRWFADAANRANAFSLIHQADAVQVTGEGLRQTFGHLHPRTVIFENQLAAIGAPPRPQGRRVRIGWAGSAGHTEDLRRVAPAVARVMARHPHARFAFMGDERQFADVFRALPAERVDYHRPGSLAAYYRFLEGLDVGLAPMNDNPYNRCRSDVKFVEYSGHGVVPVVAEVVPYLQHVRDGENAFLFDGPADLERVLDRLVVDPTLRATVAARAYAEVRDGRTEEAHAQGRVAFYRKLMVQVAASARPREAAANDVRGAAPDERPCDIGCQAVAPDSRAMEVVEAEAETLLVDGIREQARAGSASARRRFLEALERDPGYALPAFWLGQSDALAGDVKPARLAFKRALAGNPRSLRSLLALVKLESEHDPTAARALCEQAAALAPRHTGAHEAMGALAAEQGELSDALEHYRRALDLNPWSAPAARGLARAALALGDEGSAMAAFERAVSLSPQDAGAHAEVAGVFYQRGHLLRAAQLCVRAVELDPGNDNARALMQRLISSATPA